MAIFKDLVGDVLTQRDFSWEAKDSLLYALSIGAGATENVDELHLTTENSRGIHQQVVPTYLVAMGMAGDVSTDALGDFSLAQVLHGGQRIVVYRPIPAAGAATATFRMTAVYDKGRNAVIETTTSFADRETGKIFGESIGQIVVKGEGGWGGDKGPADDWAVPDRTPDHVVSLPTAPTQALIYRLNGDNNPLHSDPAFARKAGFDQPILHGLCTYGFAARAVVNAVSEGDFDRLRGFDARFTSPVVPGDRLDVQIWNTCEGAHYRTLVGDRIVLDRGLARF